MKFYVISSDGRKFGPADVQTLNQWVRENRLNRDTMLENADTGQQLHARDVPGLQFIAAAADLGGVDSALKAGEKPLATTSFQTPGNPYVAGHPEQHSTPAQGQYASPPQPGSPYPRGGVYSPGDVPAELQGGFNAGAFFLTWIWGLNHRAYWTLWVLLIGLIPCGGLIFAIYCGIKGNEAAWRSGRFSSPQECLACQRIWMWWGIGVVVFSIVGYIGLVILGVAFGGN